MASAAALTLEANLTKAAAEFVQVSTSVKDVGKALADLTAKAEKAIERLEKVGQAGEEGAEGGLKLDGALLSLAGRVGPLASGLGFVSASLADMAQKSETAGERLKGLEDNMKRLVQVSGSLKEFQSLRLEAQQLALREGFDENYAANLLFAAKSQGLGGDVGFLASTAKITDPFAITTAVGKFQAAFGKGEAGTAQAIASKLITAAEKSDVDVETIAPSAIIAAQGQAALKGSDEELLGVLAILSPAFKSPDIAADRIKALQEVVNKGYEYQETAAERRDRAAREKRGERVPPPRQIQFGGAGLLAGMERFAREAPNEFQQALLGRAEAGQAFQAITTNRSAIDAMIAEIQASGQTLDPLKTKLAIAEQDPTLAGIRAANRAKLSAQVAQTERYAPGELEYQRHMSTLQAEHAKTGMPSWLQFYQEKYAGAYRFILGTDAANAMLRRNEQGTYGPGAGAAPAADQAVRDLNRSLKENTEATRRNSRASGGPELRPPKMDDREGQRR